MQNTDYSCLPIGIVLFKQYFTGNRDRNSVVMYPFNPPIKGRLIRVVPWGWRSHISMRVEFYGCYTGMSLEKKCILKAFADIHAIGVSCLQLFCVRLR